MRGNGCWVKGEKAGCRLISYISLKTVRLSSMQPLGEATFMPSGCQRTYDSCSVALEFWTGLFFPLHGYVMGLQALSDRRCVDYAIFYLW